MTDTLCFFNEQYLPLSQIKISILDLGIVRGYGVFDYMRTYQKRPFHLTDHLKRLAYSAKIMDIPFPYSFQEVEEIINTLLNKVSEEVGIKIILTGGVAENQMLPSNEPTFLVLVFPLKSIVGTQVKGIKVITTPHQRSFPTVKTLYYSPAILSLKEAAKKQAAEAIHLNDKNELLEATTSNLLAFKGNVLISPPSSEILVGITREVLFQIGKPYFKIEERVIPKEEIQTLDEFFLCSSNKEVLPITQIDDVVFPIGKNTVKLADLFTSYTKQESWPELVVDRYETKETRETTHMAL